MRGPWDQEGMPRVILTFIIAALATGVYCAYGFWAYHPSDDGVVLAMAWRVFNGEVPYRDFLSMRTPLSPYLHTVWFVLPESWQFLAARLGFYVQISLSVLLPLWWAMGRGLAGLNTATVSLAVLFWFMAVHIFPPMPWTTLDGMMMGSIGLFLCLYSLDAAPSAWRGFVLRFGGGVFLCLAALCKQGFVILPIVFVLASLLELMVRRSLAGLAQAAAAVLSVALSTGVFWWWLVHYGLWAEFVVQVVRAPVYGNLWLYGLGRTWSDLWYLLPVGLLAAAWVWVGRRPHLKLAAWVQGLIMVAITAPLAYFVLHGCLTQSGSYSVVAMGTKGVLWLTAGVGVGAAVWLRQERPHDFWPMVVLCGGVFLLAWSASLSMGWNTPLPGMGGAGAIYAVAYARFGQQSLARRMGAVVALVCAAAVAYGFLSYNYQRPYMDQPRAKLTHDLGDIYPRFGSLRTNAYNYERHAELAALTAKLTQKYPQVRLVVVGDFPLHHYLSGTMNPTAMDWWHPWEGYRFTERLKAQLKRPNRLMLLGCLSPKGRCECDRKKFGWHGMHQWVRKNFPYQERGKYFCVYGRIPRSQGSQ